MDHRDRCSPKALTRNKPILNAEVRGFLGYSLIRKILERAKASLSDNLDGRPMGNWLLEPTRIYVKPLLALLKDLPVHALAHITGGGITENLPRMFWIDFLRIMKNYPWPR